MNLMKLFCPKLILSLLIFLCIFRLSFAEENKKCLNDFEAFGKDLLEQIPTSIILRKKSDGVNGELSLKIDGVRALTLMYNTCDRLVLRIDADRIDPANLKKFIAFIRPLISQAAPGMDDILNSLTTHLPETILSFKVTDVYLSYMGFNIKHYPDGTINIDILAMSP